MGSGTVPNSSETGALPAGDYSYQAVYAGDDNFKSSTGPCEPFTVNMAATPPAPVATLFPYTTLFRSANKAALGTKVHDTAAVTSANSSFTISGSVSYQPYNG